MGWVRIDPGWRETMHQAGLVSAADFLRLPGLILCGHPDRHVLKVDPGILPGAFLKKEHRVPWRDRLANALTGHGFVSKSTREASILSHLAQAGIPCPEVLAHGETGQQAFLLLREKPGMTDLRHYLLQYPEQRLVIARAMGRDLARIHAAGFQHSDLYTKHVLVAPGPSFCFLDWQRSRYRRQISWAGRCRDLATLDATLPESVAADRVRLACLRSYARNLIGPSLKTWATRIRRLSLKLQQKRRIRDVRRVPLPLGTQNLIWLDGEALCVTRAFREEIGGRIPEWLRFRPMEQRSVEECQVTLSNGRAGNLVRRTARGLGRWCLSRWRRLPAPEVRHAALLFRLERHGVPCPKLLAFGQRRLALWSDHSFLLTESLPVDRYLHDLLTEPSSLAERGNRLREAGALLRGVHDAGYVLGNDAGEFTVSCAVQKGEQARLSLTRVDRLKRKTKPWTELALLELPTLRSFYGLRATDTMRFFAGYVGTTRLTLEGRSLARRILARLPGEVAR